MLHLFIFENKEEYFGVLTYGFQKIKTTPGVFYICKTPNFFFLLIKLMLTRILSNVIQMYNFISMKKVTYLQELER